VETKPICCRLVGDDADNKDASGFLCRETDGFGELGVGHILPPLFQIREDGHNGAPHGAAGNMGSSPVMRVIAGLVQVFAAGGFGDGGI
jgi:hypothetical protein